MKAAWEHLSNIFSQNDINLLEGDAAVVHLPLSKQILAGFSAGIAEHVGLFPLDTIKTHMQVGTERVGFFNTFYALYKVEGFFRLYKGVTPVLLGCLPAHAGFFYTYEIARRKFNIMDGKLHWIKGLAVGLCATIAHDMLMTPMDVIKQRLQLRRKLFLKRCVFELIQKEGVYSLYRSLPITMLMNAPFNAIMITIYENTKTILNPKKWNYPFLAYFYCASAAGCIASIITNPMDVIKTKLQTQNISPSCDRIQELMKIKHPGLLSRHRKFRERRMEKLASLNGTNWRRLHRWDKKYNIEECENCPKVPKMAIESSKIKYIDIRSTIKSIYIEEGWHGFARGIAPRAFNSSLATTFSWVTYEFVKSIFAIYSNMNI